MRTLRTLATAALTFVPALAVAQPDVTPNLGAVVTGAQAPGVWYTDRYAPAAFETVAGPVAGRTDVLHIGISDADASGNRPAPYGATFYNTQGRKYDLNASGAFTLSADLYVDAGWASASNGYVRSDMWGTLKDDANAVTGYGILGFTNFDGPARFRGYDSNTGLWTDAGAPVLFGSWNTLAFSFDGLSTLTYSVNGASFFSFDVSGSTKLGDAMFQAYNFGQDFGPNDGPNYDVFWSNTPTSAVPEPASVALMATGLVGLAAAAYRRRRA
jgi:hypothetical protein